MKWAWSIVEPAYFFAVCNVGKKKWTSQDRRRGRHLRLA